MCKGAVLSYCCGQTWGACLLLPGASLPFMQGKSNIVSTVKFILQCTWEQSTHMVLCMQSGYSLLAQPHSSGEVAWHVWHA